MNFTEVTTTAMMPVSTQPTALIVRRRRQPWLLVRSQWRTMPACEIVKSMNTPTAYSGISAWVEAPPAMTTAPATEPSRMIPVENARRSPRNANWRGMKPSSASTAASRGKAANEVLAARNSSSAVNAWNR